MKYKYINARGFGERLRYAMLNKKISCADLAQASEISRKSVYEFRSGSRVPCIDTIVNLADILGVSIDYLIGRKDK